MPNCISCNNAVFDELWGDYKCSISKRPVYNYEHVGCEGYYKGVPNKVTHDEFIYINPKEI